MSVFYLLRGKPHRPCVALKRLNKNGSETSITTAHVASRNRERTKNLKMCKCLLVRQESADTKTLRQVTLERTLGSPSFFESAN
jgi:hypothetical protein